jgi:hypothetical protein
MDSVVFVGNTAHGIQSHRNKTYDANDAEDEYSQGDHRFHETEAGSHPFMERWHHL